MAANLLKEAKDLGMVRVLRGLRLYGRNTRPIHKALEHSFDPFIPGVSGSESQAVQFLADLEIGLKEDDRWRRLADLSLDEQRRLATAIIRERLKLEEERAWDIFGDVYTFTHRPPELSDAREFATLLNACGRTGNFRLAIELALGSEGAIPMAQGLLEDYRRMICSCLDLLSEACRITDHATYVLGMEKVPPTLIGVLISIALRSNLVPQEKPVFGFAASKDGLKVSARCLKPGMDLGKCLREVIGRIGGFAGGHRMAAGGFIGVDGLEDFIKLMDEELSKHA
jgi:RecJ-like exonuclease